MEKIDLLIVGVGGQGVVLASDILGEVGMASGYDVKKADALGMAQRGGSVVSHVRWGEKVHSPLVRKGDADLLVAFEKLEAARWAEHLRPDGVALVNNESLMPLTVSSGYESYPDDDQIEDLLRYRTNRVYLVDGPAIAEELQNRNILNVIILGFLSSFLPVARETWIDIISHRSPSKFLELNLRAFDRGKREAQKKRKR